MQEEHLVGALSHQIKTIYAGIDGDDASYSKIYDGGTTWNLLRNDDNTEDDWLYSLGWWCHNSP